jgi:CDGSH-type Zn-finger protein
MNKPTIALNTPVQVTVESGRNYAWCACGLSKKQPFCDGSHQGTAFSPLYYRATETGTKWFCACKQTQRPPFCDGTHKQL